MQHLQGRPGSGRPFSCAFQGVDARKRIPGHGSTDSLADQKQLERELREIAENVAGAHEVEIYDLVYRRSGPRWKVSVFLSRPDAPVSLEDCEKVSRQLSRELDVFDPVPNAYDLEVSSPGLDAPLREAWHWSRAVGAKARVKWRRDDGRAETSLVTIGRAEPAGERVILVTESGEEVEMSLDAVLSARLHVEW